MALNFDIFIRRLVVWDYVLHRPGLESQWDIIDEARPWGDNDINSVVKLANLVILFFSTKLADKGNP